MVGVLEWINGVMSEDFKTMADVRNDELWGEWIVWNPGPCPVPSNTLVQAEVNEGSVLLELRARDLDWMSVTDPIGRYRVEKTTVD